MNFTTKRRRLPKRWRETSEQGAYNRAVELGLGRRKTRQPYTFVVLDGDKREVIWRAPYYQLNGNVIVTLELEAAGEDPDPPASYRSFVSALNTVSRWCVPLSRFTWLLGSDIPVIDIHRSIGSAIGIECHSFCVISLFDGGGIGWDAAAGVMTEIEPGIPHAVR